MRLFLSGDFQNEILRYQIDRVTHLDEFLVLIDRFVLSPDHTANHRDHVGAVVGRLQKGLCALKIQPARHAAFEHFDPVSQLPRVTELFLNVAQQRLFDFFCAHAVEINRVGQIIFHRLQFHSVRFSQLLNDILVSRHG